MEQTKNLCAQIPISLHTRIREEQTRSEQSLSEYITEILTQCFEGGSSMAGTRTLAVQIPEELFQKLKAHLTAVLERQGRKISQKECLLADCRQKVQTYLQLSSRGKSEGGQGPPIPRVRDPRSGTRAYNFAFNQQVFRTFLMF